MSYMLVAFLRGEFAWLYIPKLPPSPVLGDDIFAMLWRNCGWRIGGRGVTPVSGVDSREA